MNSVDWIKKNQGLGLSRALAREHLAQAGLKKGTQIPRNGRLAPLAEVLSCSLEARAPAGLSKGLVKKLAGVSLC